MHKLFTVAIALAACASEREPPPCPAPPPAPVRIAPPPPAKPRVPLDATHWKLGGNAATFANAGVAMHYCCTANGRATHHLEEIDRPGTWTISVHHRKTECENGLAVMVYRPGDELRPSSLARFAHDRAAVTVTVDGPQDRLELEIIADGGKDCCDDVTFDRVELERSDVL